jgi:methionyl aminopeptidase
MQSRGRVVLKSKREIEIMREAGVHVAEILHLLCEAVRPGVSTWDLDQIARKEIAKRKITSPFLGYHGYPAVICASVNQEVVHGIPRKDKILVEGDIIGIDFGVVHRGYVSDSARTVGVGRVSMEAEQLIRVTRECLDKAVEVCSVGVRLSEIGRVVQTHAESFGYGVVRDFVGHGIGTRMHEDPQVLNYYNGPKPRMQEGLVIAIEPMINAGGVGVKVMEDGWTAVTQDGRLSAHFEDTIALTEDGPQVLSRL